MSELLKVNVNDKTEKKGQLTYLSWAWAWAEVLKVDPAATWVVHTYGPQGSEQPCMWIGETAMVHTSVTVNGLRRECMLPVMDNRNMAVKNPDARKISDAIMRCMTKAISMHGLGLYIYAGEDLPEADEPKKTGEALIDKQTRSSASGPVVVDAGRVTLIELAASVAVNLFRAGEKDAAYDKVEEFLADNEEHLLLHQLLQPNSAFRTYIKFRRDQAAKRQQPETEEEAY
jgi:hypothetical protein